MQSKAARNNAIQRKVTQSNAKQSNAKLYKLTKKCTAMQNKAKHRDAEQCRAALHDNAKQCSTIQCKATPRKATPSKATRSKATRKQSNFRQGSFFLYSSALRAVCCSWTCDKETPQGGPGNQAQLRLPPRSRVRIPPDNATDIVRLPVRIHKLCLRLSLLGNKVLEASHFKGGSQGIAFRPPPGSILERLFDAMGNIGAGFLNLRQMISTHVLLQHGAETDLGYHDHHNTTSNRKLRRNGFPLCAILH